MRIIFKIKNIFIFVAFFSPFLIKAQLPYTLNNICLDRIKDLSTGSLTVGSTKNLVVKDFNGDNYDDVLEANYLTNAVYIYTNQAGTGFTKMTILTGLNMNKFNSITVGDFNGDTKFDIAIAGPDSIKIYQCLGGFSFPAIPSSMFSILGYTLTPNIMKAAKLNNDNFDDLVLVTKKIGITPGISILVLRTVFTAPSSYTFIPDYTKQAFQSAVAISSINCNVDFSFGDIDNDSFNDILFTYANKQDCVLILKSLFNINNLNYLPVSAYKPAPIQTYSVTYGNCKLEDLNHDNFADLVLITKATNGSFSLEGFALVFGGPAVVGQVTVQPALGQSIITSSNIGAPVLSLLPNDFDFIDINQDGFKDLVGINDKHLWVFFWDKFLNTFDQAGGLMIDLPMGEFADLLAIGNFDDNNLRDLFFKSWFSPNGKPGVIPNFTYRFKDTVVPKNICPGGKAVASITIKPIMTPPVLGNHSVDWYKINAPDVYLATGPNFTITNPGSYYPVFTFTFPAMPLTTCSIKHLRNDTILVGTAPGPIINITPPNPQICPGGTVTLSANTGTLGIVNYTWSTLSGSFSTQTSIVATATSAANYSVIGTDQFGCRDTNSVVVNIYPPDPSTIFAPKNPICIGDSTSLTLPAASYTWSTGSNQPIIFVKPTTDSIFYVTINDIVNGCKASKSILIKIDGICKIKIYNTVTPNNDQLNDVFTIDNIDRFPDNTVQIFNRWGTSVFWEQGYDNKKKSWPNNDYNITPSTYYYCVDLGDGSPKLKGWIEILTN